MTGYHGLSFANVIVKNYHMATKKKKAGKMFDRFSTIVTKVTGRPAAFLTAFTIVIVWAVSGPLFGFSDTWQLVINTGTTIITFLMVFLIQATQNRDTQALQIKLDELIRATEGAHNKLLDLEELEEADLIDFQTRYQALAKEARECSPRDPGMNGVPDIDLEEVDDDQAPAP